MTLATVKLASGVRAALYIRASTGEQDASCDQQVGACSDKAEQLGLTVVETFRDDGISGARHDRPAYRQMLQAAELKQFDTLVLWKQSRLGRDSVEVERAIRRLEFHGLRIITVDGYDTAATSLKNRKLIRGVKGLIDETYLDDLREDTLRGLSDQFDRGYWTGGKPYGYKLAEVASETETDVYGRPKRIGSKLQVDQTQAKFVLEAFQRYADGDSALMIAADFNRCNVPSPGSFWKRKQRRPSKWLASTLSSDPKRGYGLLNNTLYTGKLEWKRSSWAKDPEGVRRQANRPEAEKLTRSVPELRIVPQELWSRVRERQARAARGVGAAISLGIAAATKRRGGRGSRYWLGSILTCGLCGANLIGDSRDDYVCPSHSFGGAAACDFDLRFRRSAIDAAVFGALEQALLSDDAMARATAYVRSVLKDRARDEAAADSAAGRCAEVTKLDGQEAALRGLALPAAAMAAALAAIDRERTEILERATESRGRPQRRAERLIARLPLIVAEMRELIGTGVRSLSTPERIAAAREATRKLLEGGQIAVKPNVDHTAIVGEVSFMALGSHLLEVAGIRRELRGTGVEKPLVNQLQENMVAGARVGICLLRVLRGPLPHNDPAATALAAWKVPRRA